VPDVRQHDRHPDPRPLRAADRPDHQADHQAGPAPRSRVRRRRRPGAAHPAADERGAVDPVPALLERQPDHRQQLQELRHAVHHGRHDAGSGRRQQPVVCGVAGAGHHRDADVLPLRAGALAIIFGAIGYNQVASTGDEGTGGGKGMAVAGMVCGGVSLLAFLYYILN
jgi:hypothetical protein